MDGWITIGTELDTKKFDRQVKELENKVDREEEKLSGKLGNVGTSKIDLSDAEKNMNNMEQSVDNMENGMSTISKLGSMLGGKAGTLTKSLGSIAGAAAPAAVAIRSNRSSSSGSCNSSSCIYYDSESGVRTSNSSIEQNTKEPSDFNQKRSSQSI